MQDAEREVVLKFHDISGLVQCFGIDGLNAHFILKAAKPVQMVRLDLGSIVGPQLLFRQIIKKTFDDTLVSYR